MTKPHDPAGLVKEAIDGHAKALGGLFDALADGKQVDFAQEAQRCTDRMVTTASRFVLFWDNIATLMADTGKAPLLFGPPPVGGPNCTTSLRIPGVGLNDAVPVDGLRRRGAAAKDIAVPLGGIQPTADGNDVVITIQCAGIPRGLYELVVEDATGHRIAHNVYVDPA